MRYSKTHVNEIVDSVMELCIKHEPGVEFDPNIQTDLELLKEEHHLIDRRKSSTPEYKNEIVHDFLELKFSYKELMKKYHCSMRTVRGLLMEAAEDNERVYNEIEFRRH